MEKKPIKKENQKAALRLATLLENKQFLKDRDRVIKLVGISQFRAIQKLAENYLLTDTMLDEIFREFPTLGSNLRSNDLFRIEANTSGSVGFPVKVEISSLAGRDDIAPFIKDKWPRIKNILEKGKKTPVIKSPKLDENYEIDFWIYWLKEQKWTTSRIRRVIKDEYDRSIQPQEISARYSNEKDRRNKRIASGG